MFSIPVYLLCLPAFIMLLVTSYVRANDIARERDEDGNLKNVALHWKLRILGFALVGGASAGFMLEPIWYLHDDWLYKACAVGMLWGFALVWFTTPGLPPWWRYHVTGEFRITTGRSPAQGQVLHHQRKNDNKE